MNKLSVIIPAYNEEQTIIPILKKVLNVALIDDFAKEVIVVNDCSKDNTAALIEDFQRQFPDIPLILHNQPQNRGKGAAIRKGIEFVTGNYVIIQDADLEYDPNDYNALLQKIVNERLPVVYGSRFLNRENKHSYERFYLGGRVVTIFTNILFGQALTDEPTCYKLFCADTLKSISLKCTGFEFCPEVTAKVAKKGIRIKEIPIAYYPRTIEDGKKIKWIDGIEAIWTLLKYRFVN